MIQEITIKLKLKPNQQPYERFEHPKSNPTYDSLTMFFHDIDYEVVEITETVKEEI